jgi:hypothetical protein
MVEGVPTYGSGDAQDEFSSIGGVNAKDTVHIVCDQAEAGNIQVIGCKCVDRQLTETAGLSAHGEGPERFHMYNT